jgi:hypothetical protein
MANENYDFSTWEVMQIGGFYKYVNHDLGLATTGFKTIEGLHKNADIIRISPTTHAIMRSRYTAQVANS